MVDLADFSGGAPGTMPPSDLTVDPSPKALQPPPILQAISFEDVIRQVQPLLRREVQELQFHGITDEIYDALAEKADDEDLPDFGKLHTDRTGEHLILWWPTHGLQFMRQIYFSIPFDLRPAQSPFSTWGSLDVRLYDGIKSPAFSHYDDKRHRRGMNKFDDYAQTLPTLVWEVAYNENSRQLARNCARFVTCSSGQVSLAIGLVITFKGAPEREERSLERVTCSFWEKTGFAASEKLGEKIANSLVRTDGRNDDDDTVLPATEYEYTTVKGDGRAYYTYKAASRTVEIYPSTPEDGRIEILQKHTLRKPADGDKDKVVLKIPFSVVVAAIKNAEDYRRAFYRSTHRTHQEEIEYAQCMRERLKKRFPNYQKHHS